LDEAWVEEPLIKPRSFSLEARVVNDDGRRGVKKALMKNVASANFTQNYVFATFTLSMQF
jgi:hypothetical protein